MIARLALAVSATILLAAGSAYGGCNAAPEKNPHKGRKPQDCVINFSAVPEISKKIVSEEQQQPVAKPSFAEPENKPYTGPTVGVSSMVRRAPEVGYKWSLN